MLEFQNKTLLLFVIISVSSIYSLAKNNYSEHYAPCLIKYPTAEKQQQPRQLVESDDNFDTQVIDLQIIKQLYTTQQRDAPWAFKAEMLIDQALVNAHFTEDYPLTLAECKASSCRFSYQLLHTDYNAIMHSLARVTKALMSQPETKAFRLAMENDIKNKITNVYMILPESNLSTQR